MEKIIVTDTGKVIYGKQRVILLSRTQSKGMSWPEPSNGNCDRVEEEMQRHAMHTPTGEIFTLWGNPFDKGINFGKSCSKTYQFVD